MLSLLKHKLYAFPGYRIEMGGDSGGAPSPDPLVGQAAQRSADLAEKVYADNKGWFEELKPIIRDNMATQTAASKDAYAQSRIDRADYNTFGRPAIKQQAIGHGMARYVDDATARNLYDLYTTRDKLIGKSNTPATSQVSFVGSDGASRSVDPAAALKSINAWRGTTNKAAAANVSAQLKALQDAGYKLTKGADGAYQITGTPQSVTASDLASNDKAIWDAERGIEKSAIAAETQRAADDAGTDVTQAISKNNSMLERQGRGMVGFNPNKFARTIASNGVGLQNTALTAGAVNSARENARRGVVAMSDAGTANTINTTRGLPSQAMNWANTGNAQAAGVTAAGMAPITANNQTTTTALQGFGTAGQLMNSQYGNQLASYNAQQANSSSGIGSVLGMGKVGMDIATAAKGLGWIGSDRRLKENIVRVGETVLGLGLYEFNYIGDSVRLRGVMADEVEAVKPEAVTHDDLGYASVNYGMLGIEMEEV